MTDGDELIDCLLRRGDLLSALVDRPMERYELVDRVDASKSTVYKGVSQLTDLGLIEPTSQGLEPTLFGVVAYERYRDLADAARFADLLSGVARNSPLEPVVLRDAEVVTPTEHAVDRHFERAAELIRDADSLRGFSPVVSPRYVALFRERVLEGTLDAELILEADLIERVAVEHPDLAEAIDARRNVTLFVTDAALPFGLLLTESAGRKRVTVELREGSVMTGLVVNDTAVSVRWAESLYCECKRTAEAVTTGTDHE